MKGIIVSDFELIIKRNEYNIEDVKQNIQDIKKCFNELSKCIKSNDLKFLTNKIDLELDQFKNVVSKINAYQTTLKNVLKSYQFQEIEIAKDIKRLTP